MAKLEYGDRPVDVSRPKLQNADGSFSTERTSTFEINGQHVNIPTIIGGEQRTDDEALTLHRTGKNPEVGVYRTQDEAISAAQRRSSSILATREDQGTRDLAPGFMGFRDTDQEEEDYQRELDDARRLDQEETFQNTISDMPELGEDHTPRGEGEGGSEGSTTSQVDITEHPVVKFLTSAPGNITKGTWDALSNTTDLLVGKGNVQAAENAMIKNVPGYAELNQASQALYQSMGGDGAADKLTQTAAQFFVPFMGWMKALNVTTKATGTAAKVGQAFSADAIATYTSFEPHMERFSGILQEFGLENDFINYVASTEGSDLENRFKNAVDATAAGAVLSPIIWGGAQALKRGYYVLKGTDAPRAPTMDRLKGPNIELNKVEADKIKAEFVQSQPGKDLDQAMELAAPAQKELAETGFDIAKQVGVKFKDPGIKGKPRAAEKVAAGKKVGELTDLSRGGFVVDSVKQGDQVVNKLGQKFDIVDEGITVTQAGYFDRKVMVRTANGTVSEIQVMTKNLNDAKGAGGGHKLYVATREMEVAAGPNKGKALPGQEAQAMEGHSKMFQIYFDAMRQEGKDVQKTYIKGLNEKTLATLGLNKNQVVKALKSDSSIEMPFAKASVPDSRAQASAVLSNENASKGLPTPGEVKTAGLSSSEINATNSSGVKGGEPGSSMKSSSNKGSGNSPTEESIQKVHEKVEDFQPLKEAKSRYFTRPKGTQDVDVSKIIVAEAHKGGLERGYKAMSNVSGDKSKRRKPVSLVDMGDGSYRVLDGNSTVTLGAASGWKKIPAKVVKIDPKKTIREIVMVDGVERVVRRKGREILAALKSGEAHPELVMGDL